MNFESYLDQAWNDHPTQSEKVAQEFSKGLALVESNEQLSQFVNLVNHVMGEHLAKWQDGISLLQSYQNHPHFKSGTETEKAIHRCIAALKIGDGQNESLDSFSLSDQVRILAVSSSALSGHDVTRSQNLLKKALSYAEKGLDQKDPANRALAVTGNNLACALEEKSNRSSDEVELMILAAQTGRKYWELAGTWSQVSFAEYRLAMTYIAAKDAKKPLQHAQNCLQILKDNLGSNFDFFYAYEALALAEKHNGNLPAYKMAVDQAKDYFAKLDDKEKSWAESTLQKLQ